MPGELTRASFEPHLNTKFTVSGESIAETELELVEITEKQSGTVYAFSLLFVGPEALPLDQMTYHVVHGKMGNFDLFLVPVGKTDKGLEYEAVFTRFVE